MTRYLHHNRSTRNNRGSRQEVLCKKGVLYKPFSVSFRWQRMKNSQLCYSRHNNFLSTKFKECVFFLAFLLNIRSKIWILYLVRKTEIVGKKLLSFRWFYVSIVLDFWNDMNLQFRKHNKMHFQKDIPSHLPLPW